MVKVGLLFEGLAATGLSIEKAMPTLAGDNPGFVTR